MLLELFISELVLLSAYAMPAPLIQKDKVYLVYPEERELKCKDYVEEDIGEVNDTYLACFRKELYSDGVR